MSREFQVLIVLPSRKETQNSVTLQKVNIVNNVQAILGPLFSPELVTIAKRAW